MIAPDLKAIAFYLYDHPGWQYMDNPNRVGVLRQWGWARRRRNENCTYSFHLTAEGKEAVRNIRKNEK